MLYQVGALTMVTDGLDVEKADIETSADFAKHALIGARPDLEFAGPGNDSVELSGELLPFHIGGLGQLEFAKALCTSGAAQFVMRGDGNVLGWHNLIKVRERHESISEIGTGFVIAHELQLERCSDAGEDVGAALIGTILSLFE